MRPIAKLIIHCSDTPSSMDVGVKEITEWHINRGWKTIGYHYVIRRDGTIEKGRDELEVGAHVEGHNKDSIGICMVGGKPAGDFTKEQWKALEGLVDLLCAKYPDSEVYGHYEFNPNKTCPTFDVHKWLDSVEGVCGNG